MVIRAYPPLSGHCGLILLVVEPWSWWVDLLLMIVEVVMPYLPCSPHGLAWPFSCGHRCQVVSPPHGWCGVALLVVAMIWPSLLRSVALGSTWPPSLGPRGLAQSNAATLALPLAALFCRS